MVRYHPVMPTPRRFPPPWTVEELDAMSAGQPMTAEQAATLKRLAKAAYELDAFKPNLTRAEADLRCQFVLAVDRPQNPDDLFEQAQSAEEAGLTGRFA
jgi:hypothetical protein